MAGELTVTFNCWDQIFRVSVEIPDHVHEYDEGTEILITLDDDGVFAQGDDLKIQKLINWH